MDVKDYDARMFLLSVSSCAGANCKGPMIDLDVYRAIRQTLKTPGWNLEDWEIVWGPAVRVIQSVRVDEPQVYPTDVMFVARNSSSYFVSVAATNYLSIFDAEEDFRAQTQRPWRYAAEEDKPAGKISRGFNESLKILQTLKPGRELPGEGLQLREFLSEQVKASDGSIEIITGGHSQGGATAPLVALWLLDTQEAEWDSEVKAKISCYRSAGPTPGDREFADYYNSRLPNTFSLVNPLDFVTKIFVKKEIKTIPEMYGPRVQATFEIRELVGELRALAETGHYKQIAYGPDQLVLLSEAKVNTDIYETVPLPNRCQRFARQMGYQHAQAYFQLLGISSDIDVKQFDGLCSPKRPRPIKPDNSI